MAESPVALPAVERSAAWRSLGSDSKRHVLFSRLETRAPGSMALNIASLRDHLAMANRHIASGNCVVIRQRQLIKDLEADGHDTRQALTILARFEDSLALHLAHRDRLIDELQSLDG